MMSILRACIAGLAVMAFPAMALAAGITYDCDTAADHFSELVLPTGSAPFTVSGKVRLNSLATSKKYASETRIQIVVPAAPGQPPSAYAGFSLGAISVDAKKSPTGNPTVQMLSFAVNGKEDETLPSSVTAKPGNVQPFTLAYDGNNVVVTLGNDSRTFPLKAAEPAVRITCSTGEFLYTDLAITPSH